MRLLQPASRPGETLIIVPPCAAMERPALGPHLLQACARAHGFEVRILYASLHLAAAIGESRYSALCYSPIRDLLGEHLFAATAYGSPPLRPADGESRDTWCTEHGSPRTELGDLPQLEAAIAAWVEQLVSAVLDLGFDIVGCSTSFQQTAASIALLKRVKARCPGTTTIVGGSNCEGDMAEGILSLDGGIDFVFSGESESSFLQFLAAARAGRWPLTRVVQGQPCANLDALPTPDFADYYDQIARFLPGRRLRDDELWLPYETSRGCWWGQKHHCTFCGLNGLGMNFRAKSPDRVIGELTRLIGTHPSTRVTLVDNIMPHAYFRDLLPRLATELPGLHLFYEQKANLSLSNVVALRRAGFAVIQPGIEALSTPLLERMDKGVTARQNIALLRYARAVDLSLTWNLLCQIPGDRLDAYEQTLRLLPLLRHLHPPAGLARLIIDRFSPYFDHPERYGVSNIRPWAAYHAILPEAAAVSRVAYHFDGDYQSDSRENPGVLRAIADQVDLWRQRWESDEAPPALAVVPITGQQFLLHDTRGIAGTREMQFLTREQAQVALAGARRGSAMVEWALERQLLAEVDSHLVPLATAAPALLEAFEADARRDNLATSRCATHHLPAAGMEARAEIP